MHVDIELTKCGHPFCGTCLFMALREKNVCPVCRAPQDQAGFELHQFQERESRRRIRREAAEVVHMERVERMVHGQHTRPQARSQAEVEDPISAKRRRSRERALQRWLAQRETWNAELKDLDTFVRYRPESDLDREGETVGSRPASRNCRPASRDGIRHRVRRANTRHNSSPGGSSLPRLQSGPL